jgi:hypothetical protein
VVAQEVDLVTSVVVQTAVVQEVAQEMELAQVEDQRLDPVDVQLAIAKQVLEISRLASGLGGFSFAVI